MLMLMGVFKNGLIVEKRLDLLDDGGGEIGVLFVDSAYPNHNVADFLQGILRGKLLGLEKVIFGDIEIMLDRGRSARLVASAGKGVVFIVREGFL
jgi:hypothetical protein